MNHCLLPLARQYGLAYEYNVSISAYLVIREMSYLCLDMPFSNSLPFLHMLALQKLLSCAPKISVSALSELIKIELIDEKSLEYEAHELLNTQKCRAVKLPVNKLEVSGCQSITD